MTTLEVDQLLAPLPPLLALSRRIWLDYDAEADVLYLSFRKPQQVTSLGCVSEGTNVSAFFPC